jgi:ribonuclease HI
MSARRPHYFLRTQAAAPPAPPQWAFSLQAADHSPPITAGDLEPDASWERLQLLAVVRGLEALPEPATVILATASDVVRRGIKHGLEEWREFDWQLEHFGELIPVKNADLWRRIDRALTIHDVQIRNMRVDEPIVAEQAEHPHFAETPVKSRRQQTALVGVGSKSRYAEINDSDDTIDHWTKVPGNANSWDPGSSWNDSYDHDFESDNLSEIHSGQSVAQDLGTPSTRQNKSLRRVNALNTRFATEQTRPGRTFSLLRVRRRLRASRLHLMRRIGELWSSWVWFYEVSGLQQLTHTRKPTPLPWLRDPQIREQPHRR